MADIVLKQDRNLTATCVPNNFIDEYMTHADGEFVKIYLYLLRCMNNPDTACCTISGIADKFDHTEKDVTRALKYWEKMRLLRLEFDSQQELTGICLTDISSGTAKASASPPVQEMPAQRTCTQKRLYKFSEDESVQELVFVAERYLGHTLNDTETQSILYWLDQLGFSQDLIDYLIEQCVAKNHPSIHYMDKIALSWAEQGIHTLTEAKRVSERESSLIHTVQKAFGITGRILIDYELDYIRKWSSFGFSDEIIGLACQKTIRGAHQISFEYADSILKNWKDQNVRTVNDIKLLDAQYQETLTRKNPSIKASAARAAKGTTAFANFKQRTYDFEELERELLSGT